ncbi:MAG TPA: hypothetical protein VGD81_11065 [Opitutaceae bacterium]
MWLILTDNGGAEGQWLVDGLGARLPGPIVQLTGQDLVDGCRWEHRFDARGEWFRLYTATGAVVDNRNVRGVINRLRVLPAGQPPRRRNASEPESSHDTGAMLLSCLSALTCPVLNPPGAHGVSGDQRRASEWTALAQRAGFRCLPGLPAPTGGLPPPGTPPAWDDHIRGLPPRHLLVVGQRILPRDDSTLLSEDVAACCRRLAAFARCPLLGIQLIRTAAGGWLFRSADSHPNLLSAGLPVLEALAATLAPTLVSPVRRFDTERLAPVANERRQAPAQQPSVVAAPLQTTPAFI